MSIPVIDERVRYVGVTALRYLNAKVLRELKQLLVIQVDDNPVAVVVPYDIYMEAQKALWPSSLLPSLGDLFGAISENGVKPEVEAIGVTAEPRGKFPTQRDTGQPIIVDDLEELPACAHCGNPNDKPLCGECFLAGHRNGSCLLCEGGK